MAAPQGLLATGSAWTTYLFPSGDTTGAKDLAAIQAAINNLPTVGGTAYLTSGTYYVNGGISIQRSNVSFVGAGTRITKISPTPLLHTYPVIRIGTNANPVSNFLLQDFTVDQGSVPGSFASGGYGIWLNNASFLQCIRVHSLRNPDFNFVSGLGTTETIESCVSGQSQGGGFNLAGGGGPVWLDHCLSDSEVGDASFAISGGDGWMLQNCVAFGGAKDGFRVNTAATQAGILIEACSAYGNGVGSSNNTFAGMRVQAAASGVIIRGNRFTNDSVNTASSGIIVDAGASNIFMDGNDLRLVTAGPTPYINNATANSIRFYCMQGIDNRSGLVAADGSPITIYAVPAGAGQLFRISADIFATAVSAGTANYTITWTENAQAKTLVVSASVVNTLATGTDLINPDASTNITVQLTFAGFTGTVKVAAIVEQIG